MRHLNAAFYLKTLIITSTENNVTNHLSNYNTKNVSGAYVGLVSRKVFSNANNKFM